jgi:molybdopterin-guanine dinucleotide biosynthesis protein A
VEGFDAVVLAGGTGRRLGGADKASLEVGGATLLDRALAAVSGASAVVVVGPQQQQASPASARVVFLREEPAGSGPAAALLAGLAGVRRDVVVALAVDMPFAAAVVPRLVRSLAANPGCDAAVARDESGRRQPLLAAYRTAALRARTVDGPWDHRSVRDLVGPLTVIEVEAGADETLDCDEPADLDAARRRAESAGSF